MVNSVIFIMHRTVLFNCMHILQKRAPSSIFTHTPNVRKKNKSTPITTMWSPATTSKQQLKNGEGHLNGTIPKIFICKGKTHRKKNNYFPTRNGKRENKKSEHRHTHTHTEKENEDLKEKKIIWTSAKTEKMLRKITYDYGQSIQWANGQWMLLHMLRSAVVLPFRRASFQTLHSGPFF